MATMASSMGYERRLVEKVEDAIGGYHKDGVDGILNSQPQ